MQQNELLSAYMDGENVESQLTETLCKDEALQQKWARYHQIRSIMRGEEQLLKDDFSAKITVLLENEVIESVAESKSEGMLVKLKSWRVPLIQTGIAASVCFLAVFGVKMLGTDNVSPTIQTVLQTQPITSSIENVSYNAPVKNQLSQEQLEYQQHRLNILLQNHELQRRAAMTNVTQSEEEKQKSQTSAVNSENSHSK